MNNPEEPLPSTMEAMENEGLKEPSKKVKKGEDGDQSENGLMREECHSTMSISQRNELSEALYFDNVTSLVRQSKVKQMPRYPLLHLHAQEGEPKQSCEGLPQALELNYIICLIYSAGL
jgi:hypothetical protein